MSEKNEKVMEKEYEIMVTCSKCGAKNLDDARFCVSCGVSLYPVESERKRGSTCFGRSERRMDNECFGLPHGGAIAGIIFGFIIILIGLGNVFGWSLDMGAFIIFIIGVLIVAGAIYGLSRKRS